MYKHDHNILVTRTTAAHFERVKQIAPEAEFHESARAISRSERYKRFAAKARSWSISAGTSDMPVAEEAVVTLKVMGNHVDSLYDVGVAGLHRLLDRRERLAEARVVDRRCRHGRRAAQRGRRTGVGSRHCRADQYRIWRQLQRRRRAAWACSTAAHRT